MITHAEEYNVRQWLLENQNVPHKAIQLPSDEVIYNIDLETRSVDTPSFLGVTKEQGAETIYFLVDRFFGEIDLATTACLIQIENNNVNIDEENTNKKRTGFYPVPFYDITTYSSKIIESGFKEAINIQSGNYKPGKYYIKNDDDSFTLATGDYIEGKQYYRQANAESNKRYIVDNTINETNYVPGVYYYSDPNTGEMVLDNGPWNPYVIKKVYTEVDGEQTVVEEEYPKTFYKNISKTFVKTTVDGNNYRIRHYYIYDTTTKEMVLDTGPYVKDREYYSIVDKPKILFPWAIGDLATEAAGPITFSIWFYRVREDGEDLAFSYSLHTRTAHSQILDTLHVQISDDDFAQASGQLVTGPSEYQEQIGTRPTVLQDLYYKIAMKNNSLYWEEA